MNSGTIFIICHVDDFAIAYNNIIMYNELLSVLSGYIITPSDLSWNEFYCGNQAISISQLEYLES